MRKVEDPCRVSFGDGRLASRKAEAACRRFEASVWLAAMVGPMGFSQHPSEQEFIAYLRSGVVLCNVVNKIQPGVISKVVKNESLGPMPAFQHFENIRNFLVALESLKVPGFEASDFERENVENGSASKIVDCILALKSHCKSKQGPSGNDHLIYAKSPAVSHSVVKSRSQAVSSDSMIALFRHLESLATPERQSDAVHEHLTIDEQVDALIRILPDALFSSKDLVELFSKHISAYMQDREASQKNLDPLKEQEVEIMKLKTLLSTTRADFISLRLQLENDLMSLGSNLKGLSAAASGYHEAVKENKHLFNVLQELKGNIRVFCRIMPALKIDGKFSIEYERNDGSLVIMDPYNPQSSRNVFQFNDVFEPEATEDEIYREAQPLVRSVIDGYNACILAYGHNGSGKTHTMWGLSRGTSKNTGIIHMALNDLFHLSSIRQDVSYEIRAQMVEIFDEQVRDLLAEDSTSIKPHINIFCSGSGLHLTDASMYPLKSMADVFNVMKLGEESQMCSPTAVKHHNGSRRSHSVLTVHVHGKDVSGGSINSCLHLVDLAGSVSVDKADLAGDYLKEALHINKSISGPGDVIATLVQKNSHITYGNSKLTHMLQSSLGGNSKMLMLAHVSLEAETFEETFRTLKLVERASTVELGSARLNKENKEVRELKEQIDNLKKALARKEAGRPLSAYNMKENAPFLEKGDDEERTPALQQRQSINDGSLRKVCARRLSIENCSIKKAAGTTTKKEDQSMPAAASVPRWKQTQRTPPPSRRLSIENAITPKTVTENNAKVNGALEGKHDDSKTPNGTVSKQINANGRGSSIRKSLQTIGKLINGSEKRNAPCSSETTLGQRRNQGLIKSPRPEANDAKYQRRQSLTNIQVSGYRFSRRSSLGDSSCEEARPAVRTPPVAAVRWSTKTMKRWL